MTEPRRPFYRRKRWIAAGLLWLCLPALYTLSVDPAYYCYGRHWIGAATVRVYATPYNRLADIAPPTVRDRMHAYAWWGLGRSGIFLSPE